MPVFRPERERKFAFRGKEIATADLQDGKGYVSVRSLCEAFGLDPRAQRKRLMRQQGYFEPYTATILMNTAGGPQPTPVPDGLGRAALSDRRGTGAGAERRNARAADGLPR